MLSIVIPTLNEEKYLPLLLDSIEKQDFKDYEIIIADYDSKDRTREIAKKYKCRITSGGSSAKGRNNGAETAEGNLLLFLDAETKLLSRDLIKKALLEFKQRKLDIASCGLEPISKNKAYKIFYNLFYNLPAGYLENVFPYASNFILSKKEVHKKIGGFDEDITLGEDHSYARKAFKTVRFGFLRSVKLNFYPRRFKRDGWLVVGMKYYFCNFYNIFFGDVRSNIFKYEMRVRKDKKERSKITKIVLGILKIPIYIVWIIFACLGWLLIFLVLIPKMIIRYKKK